MENVKTEFPLEGETNHCDGSSSKNNLSKLKFERENNKGIFWGQERGKKELQQSLEA